MATLENTNVSQQLTRRGAGEYAGVNQLHTYADVSGLRVIPRAANGSVPKVVRIHGDYGTRTVTFNSTRTARPPVIPKGEDIIAAADTVGTPVVTDVYLGGTVDLPLPQANTQNGGYDWTVVGSYQYLQVKNRKPGTDPLPTGGYPYQIIPNDALAARLVADGISPVISSGNADADLMNAIGNRLVNHAEQYQWPFTFLPAQSVTSGLFSG